MLCAAFLEESQHGEHRTAVGSRLVPQRGDRIGGGFDAAVLAQPVR